MDRACDLLGQHLLRLALLRFVADALLKFEDALLGEEREDAQVADHVGVHRAQEELVEVVAARLAGVEEYGVAFALAELDAVGVADERERETVCLDPAQTVDEIGAGGDVAPLVASSDLERAAVGVVEVQEVVAL